MVAAAHKLQVWNQVDKLATLLQLIARVDRAPAGHDPRLGRILTLDGGKLVTGEAVSLTDSRSAALAP